MTTELQTLITEVQGQREDIERLIEVMASMAGSLSELLHAEQHLMAEETKKRVVPVMMATEFGQIMRYEVKEDTWFVVHLDHHGNVLRRFFQDANGDRTDAIERDDVSYEQADH